VTAARRLALSKHRIPAEGDAFLSAIHAAGYVSMRAFAKKLGISAAFLSRVRIGKRPMPARRADKIDRLIGYPKASW